MKFHINKETGMAGRCTAAAGNCPFGGEDEHYRSPIDARAAYEAKMAVEDDHMRGLEKEVTASGTPGIVIRRAAIVPTRAGVQAIPLEDNTEGFYVDAPRGILPAVGADQDLVVDAWVNAHNETEFLSGLNRLGKLSTEGSGKGTISEAFDFDHVLAKSSTDEFYDGVDGVYAPDTSYIEDINKTSLDDGWTLVTAGMTGQEGYRGPWLHESEGMEGGVARAVEVGPPGYYVAVVGTGALDDAPLDEMPLDNGDLGWAIAYKPFESGE